MTAVRKARACHAGAVAAIGSAIYPATQHLPLGIPGLFAAVVFLWASASYERDAREDTAPAHRPAAVDEQPRSVA